MLKLKDDIYYVGVQNPCLRIFDIIMETKYGTSYNSYLVKGEKWALVEAAHETYSREYLENIEEIVDVKEISYVILNHTEPDHTGSLGKLLDLNPDLEIIGTSAAIKNVGAMINRPFISRVVKDQETLDLGNGMVFHFIIAPNLHWPDSMFSYLESREVLFSCDFLGTHFCEPKVLDTYVKKLDKFRDEQKNYYDCIFSPFKPFVLSGLKKIEDLTFDMVCNSHGPILTEMIEETIENYRNWSEPEVRGKDAAIFYVSAYGYTRQMAEVLEKALNENGIEAKSYDVIKYDMASLAEIMNRSGAVLFGSPTINRDALKPIWDLIAMTEAIGIKNKPAMVFGSYGWSGEGIKMLVNRLTDLKYKLLNDGIKVVFRPTQEDEAVLIQAAKELAELMSK